MSVVAWMVFSIFIGVAISAAAAALEQACRHLHLPTRFVWGIAIATSLAWPAVALARSLWPGARHAAPGASLWPFVIDAPHAIMRASTTGATMALPLTALLLSAWAIASLTLLGGLLRAVRRVRAKRPSWREATVDSVHVCVSGDIGPAVVGLRRGAIVLPDWTLALDAPLRALMLRHELEHRDAGDPSLLLAAAILWRCVPWNPAVWYQAYRLRHAIELDCDARVLKRHREPERYGRLLITIAQRQSSPRILPAPTLSEPVSQLERRIRAMMNTTRTFARTRALGLVGLAAVAVAAGCAVNTPDHVTSPEKSPAELSRMAADTSGNYYAYQVKSQARQLPGNAAPLYPVALRKANISGQVTAQFVVGADGVPDTSTFKVIRTTDPAFADAVKVAVASWKYAPAEIQGHPVKQLVQQAFQFTLNPGGG